MLVAQGFSQSALPVMLIYKAVKLEIKQLLVGREKLMPRTSIDQLESVYLYDVFVKFLIEKLRLIS